MSGSGGCCRGGLEHFLYLVDLIVFISDGFFMKIPKNTASTIAVYSYNILLFPGNQPNDSS